MSSADALPKTYSPNAIEASWYAYWLKHKLFHSEPDEREPYTVVIPPPNVTGVLHMGHMLNNTIQDILIRRARMQGKNACWVPGMDHASIATEAKVVKMLREQGIKKSDLTRGEFLAHAWEWKEKYGGIILEQLKKLGASCDWERERFTMEEKLSNSVLRVFVDLYNKGLIYRGLRMVNWDPAGLTALSDEEVIFRETPGKLYYLRYRFADSPDEALTIATTRPETILADVAVAVNPHDERYSKMLGREVLIPLIDKPIPIIADSYVDAEFGTGCLKVTPAHDPNDYEIGQRHNLPAINLFNPDGTMSDDAPRYQGLDRFSVRKRIAADLEASGFLEKTEEINHSIGYSERTDAVIEPRLSLQWFVRMEPLAKPALEAVVGENPAIGFIPKKFENIYRHWMSNIRDWCISRQLWWGQRIPAYYYGDGEHDFVVALSRREALQLAREKGFDGTEDELQQDEDVLDTWFSSWLWPITVFDGLEEPDNADFRYYFPTSDLVTGPDIIFFWVARMIMASYEYQQQQPFSNVYFTGLIRDSQRRKMSKSLGNSPDVLKLIDENGADALRMGLMMSSSAGSDLLFEPQLIETGRNFCNKIWNALRLVKMLEDRTAAREPNARERLVAAWLSARIEQAKQDLEGIFAQFNILEAARYVYRLIWDDFFSWYLELVKPSANDDLATETYQHTLNAYEELMKLLHPIMPFITEEVWQKLRPRREGESICVTPLQPQQPVNEQVLEEMAAVRNVVTEIRSFRAAKNIPNKERFPLQVKTSQPARFRAYAPVIAAAANVKEQIAHVEAAPEDCHSIVCGADELFIPQTAAPVDTAAEKEKLRQEIAYTQGFLQKVQKKLANEKFVNNAPETVVEKERRKLRDAEEKLNALTSSLKQLED